jgi:hypothetical protein
LVSSCSTTSTWASGKYLLQAHGCFHQPPPASWSAPAPVIIIISVADSDQGFSLNRISKKDFDIKNFKKITVDKYFGHKCPQKSL